MQEWRKDPQAAFRGALVTGDLGRMRECARAMAGDRIDLLLCFDNLIEGVQHITRQGGFDAANELFERVHRSPAVSAEIRWGLWLWQTVSHLAAAQLDVAKTAADTALTIVNRLDPVSRAVTLAVRAALGVLQGELATGRDRLVQAAKLCASERGSAARLWLFWGEIMRATGRDLEGLRALSQGAEAVREAWASVPLARQALVARRVSEASDILVPFVQLGDRGAIDDEVRCLITILDDIHQQRIRVDLVSEYLWLGNRVINDRVAALIEALLDEEARAYPPLRQLFVWDLARAGQFEKAGQQLNLLLQDTSNPSAVITARRAQARVEEIETEWKLGVLEVARIATWQLVEDPGEDTSATELFWLRRAVASGDLERAAEELESMEAEAELVQQQREFLTAIASGEIPLEVAKEYLWLHERPVTEELLTLLRSFADENRSLEPLQLTLARDLKNDGFIDEARRILDWLSRTATSGAVQARAQGELAQLAPAREVLTEAPSKTFDLRDFVGVRLIWPSVLDHGSLLFSGSTEALPPMLLEAAETIELKSGQAVHRQGGRGELLYLLEEGELRATRNRGAPEELGAVSGGFVGELGTLYGLPNTATLTATAASRIHVIKREVLRGVTAQGTSGLVIRTLRDLYRTSAVRLSPICTDDDEAFLEALAQAEGHSRIFQRGERLSFQPGHRVAIILSGIGRVITTAGAEVTLGYLAPSDLVLDLPADLVQVQAERMMSVAVINDEEVERLSRDGQRALGFYLNRCGNALRAAEVLPAEEEATAALVANFWSR